MQRNRTELGAIQNVCVRKKTAGRSSEWKKFSFQALLESAECRYWCSRDWQAVSNTFLLLALKYVTLADCSRFSRIQLVNADVGCTLLSGASEQSRSVPRQCKSHVPPSLLHSGTDKTCRTHVYADVDTVLQEWTNYSVSVTCLTGWVCASDTLVLCGHREL